MLAILEGRDHAPEMVLDSSSIMLPALGHLRVWLEKEVTAVLCQVGTPRSYSAAKVCLQILED